jgi:hypothetical protein
MRETPDSIVYADIRVTMRWMSVVSTISGLII